MSKSTSKRGPDIWVVHCRGAYSVKLAGFRKLLVPPLAQYTAIKIARALARANNSELIVQGLSGRIRFRDSHGHDPFPPRG
jgi:hypothetical protein